MTDIDSVTNTDSVNGVDRVDEVDRVGDVSVGDADNMGRKELDEKIRSLKKELDVLSSTSKTEETSDNGITGVFDGIYMISDVGGEKYEVNPNYAAKSQLVYGDKLKMDVKEGRNFFKQLKKVDRDKIEGILSKKEGKWYLLSAAGSYKVSDIAANFQDATVHAEATAFVPRGKSNVPFATLDIVKGTEEKKKNESHEKIHNEQKVENPAVPKDQVSSLRILTDEDLR